MSEERKMRLGPATGWAPWQPKTPQVWPLEHHSWGNWWLGYTEAIKRPYVRFHERIERRQRYKVAPSPYEPGRYRTAKWQPYSGYGRFSGLRDILDGHYYAERYTGDRRRPEDYHIGRSSPEWIEADANKRWRQRSWRLAA